MRETFTTSAGADGYRETAHALRKQAERISAPGPHTSLLFTALYYEKLANQVERTEQAFHAFGYGDSL